jgi:hypothetical protein
VQASVAELGQFDGVALPLGQSAQNPESAQAQQFTDDAGQLDASFLQQRFQLILQPHPIPHQLHFGAGDLPFHAKSTLSQSHRFSSPSGEQQAHGDSVWSRLSLSR